MYRYELFLPFSWSDASGILFFGHTFALAHQAFENFVVEALNLSWNSWFQNSEWIVPIKQTEATYLNPLMPGKTCVVEMRILEVRTSSFSIGYTLFQDSVKCCLANTVHVFCNKSDHQKRHIPPSIRILLDQEVALEIDATKNNFTLQ